MAASSAKVREHATKTIDCAATGTYVFLYLRGRVVAFQAIALFAVEGRREIHRGERARKTALGVNFSLVVFPPMGN